MGWHPFQDCSQTVYLILTCWVMSNLRNGSSRTNRPIIGMPEFYPPFVKWGSRKDMKEDQRARMKNALSGRCVLNTVLSRYPLQHHESLMVMPGQFSLHKRVGGAHS